LLLLRFAFFYVIRFVLSAQKKLHYYVRMLCIASLPGKNVPQQSLVNMSSSNHKWSSKRVSEQERLEIIRKWNKDILPPSARLFVSKM